MNEINLYNQKFCYINTISISLIRQNSLLSPWIIFAIHSLQLKLPFCEINQVWIYIWDGPDNCLVPAKLGKANRNRPVYRLHNDCSPEQTIYKAKHYNQWKRCIMARKLRNYGCYFIFNVGANDNLHSNFLLFSKLIVKWP